MAHDDVVYIQHILNAILQIEEYLQGVEEEEFYRNNLIQDGVIRQLEIIGEGTKRISKTIRDRYRDIPWKDIAGMRDKLIHGYFGVDLEQVWFTAKEDIQSLKATIIEILDSRK